MNMEESHLSEFTDIFNTDENAICDSPPLSLPSKSPSPMVEVVEERPQKYTGQYKEFRSIDEIDPLYRSVFKYQYFNLVQSKVIDDALYSDKSLVVSAPTGTGKTVVFEMAIIKLLMDLKEENCKKDFKIVYMAPIKAICTERLTEWYSKFNQLGLLCIEVTGDTDVDFSQLRPYNIIITTPEKWNMLTRRWTDYIGLVEVIKLFLIDEVHILNDETRGPVLEAVVSRMKTIQASAQLDHRLEQERLKAQNLISESNTYSPTIRFVAVSATVNNPEDVATWLGTPEKPAVYHKLGEECRSVKLKKVVEGYPCADGASIFKFDIILNYKLWPVIQKYYNGKPTLIFCNTRKSVIMTGETLSREVTINFSPEQKGKLTALSSKIKNKKIQALLLNGIGCHHAGLLYEERINIENAFRSKDLPILITTTTLAMGVNLPAHLVIIKNTQHYVNGQFQEYNISTILQMVGRAGRPQFDTEATAVIMTRAQDKHRYQALVEGSEPLESYLHRHLAENLNSEIALHTISDLVQGVQWLSSTFLYVRAARNPRKYLGLANNAPQQQRTMKIEELCNRAINALMSAGLITMDECCRLQSTSFGRLMSVFYLDFETMKLFMKIEGSESLEKLLWLVCESHELSDMHLRVDERRCLNTLNKSNASVTIRFPMKGKITSRQMKLNCIIQAVLGCLTIPDPSLNQEAMKVMRVADRVCRGMVAYVTADELISSRPQFFTTIVNAITLAKCIAACLWENSPFMSKQLRGIGPAFSTLLAAAGKLNFMLIEESHPRDLERIMNKGPPAGNLLRKQVSLFPKYQLTITPIDAKTVSVQLSLLNLVYLSENMDNLTAGENHKCFIVIGDSENNLLCLMSFKDKDLINIHDGKILKTVTRNYDYCYKIIAHCISATYVGLDVQTEFTFIDLNTTSKVIADRITDVFQNVSITEMSDQKQHEGSCKQTTILDTYKPRKRKMNIKNFTVSKEKTKRENELKDKIKQLKYSIDTFSEELRNGIEKPLNTSNYTVKYSPNNGKIRFETKSIEDCDIGLELSKRKKILEECVDLRPEDFESTMDLTNTDVDDNQLSDDNIDGIIKKIENEMSESSNSKNITEERISAFSDKASNVPKTQEVNVSSKIKNDNTTNENVNLSVDLKTNEGYSSNKRNFYKTYDSGYNAVSTNNKRHITKRRCLRKFDNYSIIDKIKRKHNTCDEKCSKENTPENGFCTAAKLYLDQYFNSTKNRHKNVPKAVQYLIEDDKKYLKNDSYTDLSEKQEKQQIVDITALSEKQSELNQEAFAKVKEISQENAETFNEHEADIYPFIDLTRSENQNESKATEIIEPKNDELELITGRTHISSNMTLDGDKAKNCTEPIFNSEKHSNIINNKCVKTLLFTKKCSAFNDSIINKKLNDDDFVKARLTEPIKPKKQKVFINPLAIKNAMLFQGTKEETLKNTDLQNNEILPEKITKTNRISRIQSVAGNDNENCKITDLDKHEQNTNRPIIYGVSLQHMKSSNEFASTSTHVISHQHIDVTEKVELEIRLKKTTTIKARQPTIYTDGQNSLGQDLTSNKIASHLYGNTEMSKQRLITDISRAKSNNLIEALTPQKSFEKKVTFYPESNNQENKHNAKNLMNNNSNNKSNADFEENKGRTHISGHTDEDKTCLQDIFNKYSNLTQNNKQEPKPTIHIDSSTVEKNNKDIYNKQENKRIFNIADIKKNNRVLPREFISEIPLPAEGPKSRSILYHQPHTHFVVSDNVKKMDMPEINTENFHMAELIEDADSADKLINIDDELAEETINQTLLNPMTLLQRQKANDDCFDVIIPPPSEFLDNSENSSNTSSIKEFDSPKNLCCNNHLFSLSQNRCEFECLNKRNYYSQENVYDNEMDTQENYNNNDYEYLGMNQSQDIETWALSTDEPVSYSSNNVLLTPFQSSTSPESKIVAGIRNSDDFTAKGISKATIETNNFSRPFLNRFKFSKEKMKK